MTKETIEEAGALLGTVINHYINDDSNDIKMTTPPSGMHSSFSTYSVPTSELFFRLTALRNMLQNTSSPLNAAPSLLSILMKILMVSQGQQPQRALSTSTLDSSESNRSLGSTSTATKRKNRFPLQSTAIRRTWVECVILCYRLGCNNSGNSRVDVYAFIKRMIDLASANPKSAKASGGARLAAMETIGGLFIDDVLVPLISHWAGEILALCHRGLRSSGAAEPSFRATCVDTACSVVTGCRSIAKGGGFVYRNALEEKAILEAVKLLRRGSDDKYPEVRGRAAMFGCLLGPVVVHECKNVGGGEGNERGVLMPMSSLEDVIQISLKCLDDESAHVAEKWAEALSRCICTAADYGIQTRLAEHSNKSAKRNEDGVEDASDGAIIPSSTSSTSDILSKIKTFSESRRNLSGSISSQCSSINSSLNYLVDLFLKMGGENAASRCGSTFSVGGRAPRVGVTVALIHFLRLQSGCGNLGQSGGGTDGSSMGVMETIVSVLNMVGPVLEKQVMTSGSSGSTGGASAAGEKGEVESNGTSGFQLKSAGGLLSGRKSVNDAGLARSCCERVLRAGLGELSGESMQLCTLRDLAAFCSRGVVVVDGGDDRGDGSDTMAINPDGPNRYQLEVSLVEICHLVVALGEASSSTLEHLLPSLRTLLSHPDHSVRHACANVLACICACCPTLGPSILFSNLANSNTHRALLLALANQPPTYVTTTTKGRFRRKAVSTTAPNPEFADKITLQMNCLHGNTLAVALCSNRLAKTREGIPTRLLDEVVTAAEKLILVQSDENVRSNNPTAATTCVRTGYSLLSSLLTIGPINASRHAPLLFRLWQSSIVAFEDHSIINQLLCLEAMLTSFVSFLRYCPEWLMSIPDALNRTTLLMETLFGVLSPTGRLGKLRSQLQSGPDTRLLPSVKAILMECFTWLPPGSFPIAAEILFEFAAEEIKHATHNDVATSLLPTLVTNEDKLLDATSLYRSGDVSQVSSKSLSGTLLMLRMDPIESVERELMMLGRSEEEGVSDVDSTPLNSPILAIANSQDHSTPPPTPLHDVFSWRSPPTPSTSTKVRLLDSAIIAFAVTFGLQDGHEQERAILSLESLLAPPTEHRRFTTALLSQNAEKMKQKKEGSIISNITATLLACVRALPFHESSPDNKSRMGPPWMSKAKDLFFSFLPSASMVIRRGAAEGLASLAQIGISEDAHTLQSSILHSLDEVMKGNLPDGSPRKDTVDLNFSRSSSLLTLACLQRANHKLVAARQSRFKNNRNAPPISSSTPPTMIMMTRVLATLARSESIMVRATALHSFGILMTYSIPEKKKVTPEGQQVLFKCVQLVTREFLDTWGFYGRSKEGEKFVTEMVLLAVMIRTMSYLLPRLNYVQKNDERTIWMFCKMVNAILSSCDEHPMVVLEGLAFYERLNYHRRLLKLEEQAGLCQFVYETSFPFIGKILRPMRENEMYSVENDRSQGSSYCQRGGVICLRMLLESYPDLVGNGTMPLHVILVRLLETEQGGSIWRGMADYALVETNRDAERYALQKDFISREIRYTLVTLLKLDKNYLHWVLFGRNLVSGGSGASSGGENGIETMTGGRVGVEVAEVIRQANTVALEEAAQVVKGGSTPRWQLLREMVKFMHVAIRELAKTTTNDENHAAHFDPQLARTLITQKRSTTSYLSLHLEDLLTTACSISTTTLDHAELPTLQIQGMTLLTTLIANFSQTLDPDYVGSNDAIPCILQQYTTQIVSTIKHALNGGADELRSDDEDDGVRAANPKLFLLGCEAIRLLVKNRLIDDPIVLKRMIRPLVECNVDRLSLPPMAETGYLYPRSMEDLVTWKFRPEGLSRSENVRSALLRRWGSVATLADLKLSCDRGLLRNGEGEDVRRRQEQQEGVIKNIIRSVEGKLAVHAAALAIDTARIFEQRGLDLCGRERKETDGEGDEQTKRDKSEVTLTAGLVFHNGDDVNAELRKVALSMWPVLSTYAVSYLEGGEWLKRVVPINLIGLRDTLALLGESDDGKRSEEAMETMAICLHGIRNFIKNGMILGDEDNEEDTTSLSDELGVISLSLLTKLLIPALGLPEEWESNNSSDNSESKEQTSVKRTDIPQELVSEVCGFIEDISLVRVEKKITLGGNALIKTVLLPLTAYQEKAVSLGSSNDTVVIDIISSSLRSAKCLLQEFILDADSTQSEQDSSTNFLKAMLQLSLSIFVIKDGQILPPSIKDATSSLFQQCINAPHFSTTQKRQLAQQAARMGSWETWAMVSATLTDGSALASSLDSIREALLDTANPERHKVALSAVRATVQDHTEMIPLVMQEVGAAILNLLNCHGLATVTMGNGQDRLLVFADAMRIVMLSFQTILEAQNDDHMVPFLRLLFAVFVRIVNVNGLPNHPPSSPNNSNAADPSLGRLCAQAAVHAARSSPMAFKTSMVSLTVEERGVLEMAVRAEMTGYAVSHTAASAAPKKKKLILKGFK